MRCGATGEVDAKAEGGRRGAARRGVAAGGGGDVIGKGEARQGAAGHESSVDAGVQKWRGHGAATEGDQRACGAT